MLPSIPDYIKTHVDPNIDLEVSNSCACPFHDEVNGKSFTYSPTKKIFRCWGKCHCGGNVIRLHQLHMKLSSYEEAKQSLYSLYSIKEDTPTFERKKPVVDQKDVDYRVAYADALRVAKTPEDWIELDYIMSMYPVETIKLEMFTRRRL